MKQITIYALCALLRKGFVAMDKYKCWFWYGNEPEIDTYARNRWEVNGGLYINLSDILNIAPYDGDWKDSLMECGHRVADTSKTIADI